MRRDITQVEPAASTAITACRALLDSWCNFSAELECLGDEIAAWGRIEPPESVEYSLIDAVTVAAGQVRCLTADNIFRVVFRLFLLSSLSLSEGLSFYQ